MQSNAARMNAEALEVEQRRVEDDPVAKALKYLPRESGTSLSTANSTDADSDEDASIPAAIPVLLNDRDYAKVAKRNQEIV